MPVLFGSHRSFQSAFQSIRDSMPTRYDRQILQTHADSLYARADEIALNSAQGSALALAAVGAVIGFGGGLWLELDPAGCAMLGAILSGAIGFAWGWSAGQELAFKLRLQAQELLCQMMVEGNTADLLRLAIAASEPPRADGGAGPPLRPLRLRMSGVGSKSQP